MGLETEGPPQIQVTRSLPTIGMAERTPVMTVAPQNDIWPHGSTYPRKAVAIVISKMITPESHTFFWLWGELKYIPRAVWMYKIMKNKEAPFMCTIRVTHPVLMSCMIFTIEVNASFASELYIIEMIRPVTICRIKVIPSRNPIFQRNEIEVGVGRSRREDFTILRMGSLFTFWFFMLEC